MERRRLPLSLLLPATGMALLAVLVLSGCGGSSSSTAGNEAGTHGAGDADFPAEGSGGAAADAPQKCGVVHGGFVVRAVPSLGCEAALAASEEILTDPESSGWNCLFIGDEAHRFCNQGEAATYSTAPLFIEALPRSQTKKAAMAPTFNGTAQVETSKGSSHSYEVICAKAPSSVFVATPNIDMEARVDGTYTGELLPDDESPYMYLIDSPSGRSVSGRTTTYSSPQEAEDLNVNGSFGSDQGFGGSTEYLESAVLKVSSDSLQGSLRIQEEGGTGFTLTWEC